ncbi:MAG TPA: type II toxin-antitoxin system HicB family antitoxin [Candidatus Hypogeohydataceae bacterium YC41]
MPDFPGVYGLGKTPIQAKRDIKQALTLYIEDVLAEGEPVPESTAEVGSIDSLKILLKN